MRILIVDDHRNTREAIALALAHAGLDVETADSGHTAIQLLAGRDYDWMVCDVRMPGMSGIDVAARARTIQPSVGVVLMTAYDVSGEDRRRLAELGVGLLIKPVTAEDLLDYWSAAVPGSKPAVEHVESGGPLT